MKSNLSRPPSTIPIALIFGSLYLVEFSALLAAVGIYKKGDRPVLVFLQSQAGFVVLVAVLVLVTSTLLIICLLRKDTVTRTKAFGRVLILNLWSVVMVLLTAELVIRLFAVITPAGTMFANTLLLPRNWEQFAARHQGILADASRWGSYFVYDNMLGWTVGPSRSSSDGPYFSSVEGIRSPHTGMAYADFAPKHRVAIVGDSFTFGLEVRYEETWGSQLERMLGPDFRVLNFGVDGYGVDQAYLRYQRDVLPWRPDIVVLGMINDDFHRTMGVYGFLKFIDSEMPFPKPRFVVRENRLVLLNIPLPTPNSIFASKSITELPFIGYDASFRREEWESYFAHHAYTIRFLLSSFPRWPVPEPNVSDNELKFVNREILRSFVQLGRDQKSIPIVMYFPSRSDFAPDGTPQAGLKRVGIEVLQSSGIAYLDMTACVSRVRPTERFKIKHYSTATNAVVARCLRDSIRGTLHAQ